MKTTLLNPELAKQMSARGFGCPQVPRALSALLDSNPKCSVHEPPGQLHLTNIPPSCSSPCWKQNENPVSVRLCLKNFFKEKRAHVFNYINFILRTFAALLEKSFVTSRVLGSVGLGAVPVFVTGVNKLCCTLLNQLRAICCPEITTFHFSILHISS